MIEDFLNYYLFEYEIGVYSKYTPLSDQMIRNKMYHFWQLLKTLEYQRSLKRIIACFYDEDKEKGGKYVVLDANLPNKKPPIKKFSNALPKIHFNKDKEKAIFVPYFLFKNERVDKIRDNLRRKRDPYSGYRNLRESGIDFIWHKAFPLKSQENINREIKKHFNDFLRKHKHTKTYQELWCIVIFGKNQRLDLQQLSFSFMATIKEWGLDILKRDIIKHGTRSAVAAIMSRNMSHNIGSHVLSYWGNNLKNTTLSNELTKSSKSLFDYLKQRMDFIAEITTTVPAWEKPLSLKNDIIGDFTEQFALLDNIARSEGFCYFSEIENHPKCKKTGGEYGWSSCKDNGNSCHRLPQNLKEPSPDDLREPEPMKIIYSGTNLHVAIPHGIVGKQAFYSILENFVRNSAKHGGNQIRDKITRKQATALEFRIHAEEDPEYIDYIKITISDNIGNCCDFINTAKTIRVIDILNDAIKDDEYIRTEDGRIKKGNWGIKEMKVSANFLRKKEVDTLVIEDKKNNHEPPLMQLTCYSKCKKNKNCIKSEDKNVSVTFFLRKPKEACVLTTNKDIASNSKYGIDVFSYEHFENKLKRETIPHRFLVFDNSDNRALTLINNNRRRLPFRIVVKGTDNSSTTGKDKWLSPTYIKNIDFKQIASKPNAFLLELYDRYLSDKIGKSPTVLMRNIKGKNAMNKQCDCITEVPNNGNLGKLIIFDKHYDMIEKNDSGSAKIPNCLYYQGISGSSPFGKTLENIPEGDKVFFKELREAALVKVLIADERIWKNSQGKITTPGKQVQVERIELLKNMGIYLVPIDGNIISETKRNNVLNRNDAVVFFIIHKGLVEKMNEIRKGNNNLGTKFVENVVNKFPFVLVDSGRGEPEDLEPGTRYVPMSAIESFIEDMDKYSLVQTLFSVRRSEHEE